MNNNNDMVLPVPDKYAEFKIIQLLLDGQPFLCLGNRRSYHRSILQKFLESKNIAFDTFKKGSYDIPAPKGENYEVVGMGYLLITIDKSEKKAMFFSKSFDYGISINKEHIKSVKKQNSDWAITIHL